MISNEGGQNERNCGHFVFIDFNSETTRVGAWGCHGGRLVVGAGAHAEDASGGIKITVLYGAPKDPKEFEKHYSEVHMPMVYSVKELKRVELSVGLPDPDGKAPAFYRITELWFENPEQLQKAAATSIWKKIVDDVPTFASGGVTIVTSKIG